MSQIFITGANGEIGHALIRKLAADGASIVALDLHPLDHDLAGLCAEAYRGDIRDTDVLSEIGRHHRFSAIFHMASLLSSRGESNPELAHEVNVNGSFNIMNLARQQSTLRGDPVKLIFTSSIAVYGLYANDDREHPVKEREFLTPRTMYGINKLYVEQMGRYFSRFYLGKPGEVPIDFRCLRFPGLISSATLPSGGTTDYGPEMLHAAARGESYQCFVKASTRLPFMVMDDAVDSLVKLHRVPRTQLKHQIYNVTGFSVRADEILALIEQSFPGADIQFEPVSERQEIVDSWPEYVDDSPARRDWGWQPKFDFARAFAEILVPRVKARYSS